MPPKTEHILLESDERAIPQRNAARKIHAHVLLRSRLRRRTFVLDLIDYYFLSVQVWRGRTVLSEYMLDLRFTDPTLLQTRHIAWRWITVTLALGAFAAGLAWWVDSPLVPWWQHEALPVIAALSGLALIAGFVSAWRTTESFTLRSVHGRARVFECVSGPGMLRTLRPFATKLAAHIQIAIPARRSSKGEHLRDEMREHFRLKEAGVLAEEDYEASKLRILSTHS